MPRQPYLPNFAHLNYAVGALVLENRPEFCAAIGKSIALWGQVDNEMGNLLGLLLGTDSDAALEVFLSLRRSSSQRDALHAAAKHKLKDDNLLIFRALMGVYASLEAERNALAHGCFGISDDDPTVLYWLDIKDHVHFQVEVLSNESKGNILPDRHVRLKANMFVYRIADLEMLYAQMKEFWWAMFYFNGYLRDPSNPGRATEIAKIRSFPQIMNALAEVSAKS
jgi:hypothetical protein